MNIIERNLFRLLRAGAFHSSETIEPLSAWKWNRLYHLSVMHDVAPIAWQGIKACSNQFFVQLPDDLMHQWQQARTTDEDNNNDLLLSDRLTNPLLNYTLQDILDDEHSNTETRTMLLHLLGTARFVLNAGIPIKRIVEMGIFIRQNNSHIDFIKLQEWIQRLKLNNMVQLISVMLVRMLHFSPDELPFMKPVSDEVMERLIDELFRQKNSHAEEWYFSQDKNIFVHTSNSQAMLWSVRHSAKYFKYYPTETVTNFFTAFAHSLSHIEE